MAGDRKSIPHLDHATACYILIFNIASMHYKSFLLDELSTDTIRSSLPQIPPRFWQFSAHLPYFLLTSLIHISYSCFYLLGSKDTICVKIPHSHSPSLSYKNPFPFSGIYIERFFYTTCGSNLTEQGFFSSLWAFYDKYRHRYLSSLLLNNHAKPTYISQIYIFV